MRRSFAHSRARPLAPLLIAAILGAPSPASPQDRSLVTPDDYGRWEDVGTAEISPHGDWIAYVVTRVDDKSELRVRKLAEDSTRAFPWGARPIFSPDGRWLAWTNGLPPEERDQLEEKNEPVREKTSAMDLHTGETREFDAVSQRGFDATGRFIALRGYPPDEPGGKGADLRVVDLATGSETAFGNVGEIAWNPTGSLLALAIATGTDVGNGVQVYDAAAGTLRSADASGRPTRASRGGTIPPTWPSSVPATTRLPKRRRTMCWHGASWTAAWKPRSSTRPPPESPTRSRSSATGLRSGRTMAA